MLMDYHLHSDHSFDGKQTFRQLCDSAIAQGLEEIAVTDHMDLYCGKPYSYILDCGAAYGELRQMQEEYRGRLVIRAGSELGQPMANPQEAAQFLAENPLDFVIGSIHNMENDADVGLYDYHTVDYRKVFSHYLEWLLELARDYDYDVLGHVTYPARYIQLQTGIQPDFGEWQEQFRAIFQAAIARGKGIELNTSGIARGMGGTMPTMGLLKEYRALGGEIITMGSDAHLSCQVGSTAQVGKTFLRGAGFRWMTTYQGRVPHMVSLDE